MHQLSIKEVFDFLAITIKTMFTIYVNVRLLLFGQWKAESSTRNWKAARIESRMGGPVDGVVDKRVAFCDYLNVDFGTIILDFGQLKFEV